MLPQMALQRSCHTQDKNWLTLHHGRSRELAAHFPVWSGAKMLIFSWLRYALDGWPKIPRAP